MESKTNIDLQLFLNFQSSCNLMQEFVINGEPTNNYDQWLCTGRLFALFEVSDFFS